MKKNMIVTTAMVITLSMSVMACAKSSDKSNSSNGQSIPTEAVKVENQTTAKSTSKADSTKKDSATKATTKPTEKPTKPASEKVTEKTTAATTPTITVA